MKNWIATLILILGLAPLLHALDASVSFASFKAADQNYVEIYLHVVGKTVTFKPIEDAKLQAGVTVVVLFKQGEEIVKFDKFNLSSPVAEEMINFIDLKRYPLADGTYTLEVSIEDQHDATNSTRKKTELTIDYSGDKLLQSDVQLLASFEKSEEENMFVKNGFYLEPLPFNYYSRKAERLIFYNEVYNADKALGEDFMVSYAIKKVSGNGEITDVLIGHKRREATEVVPLLIQLDITTLESGNYSLVVEVRNRAREVLSKKAVLFQRSNPFLQIEPDSTQLAGLSDEFVNELTDEELEYSIKGLIPLVGDLDGEMLNAIVSKENANAQRMYLFNYWTKYNPNNPATEYKKYMEVVRAVDKLFKSGFGHGFETDRGYTFLKYGKPDDMITIEDDPVAPPYEIWSYNSFPSTRQNNVRFLFYNPSLAGGDFRLLHSTARGEINNPQWQLELYRDAPTEIEGSNYIDGTQMKDNFGRHADRYFNDF